jgi:hypothetical protein
VGVVAEASEGVYGEGEKHDAIGREGLEVLGGRGIL